MGEPVGFMLTFRTYGTWLHGDPRGSVDDQHNVYDTPFLEPDEARWQRAFDSMRFPPLVFDGAMRRVVDESIVDTCSFHGWELIERAVRTNHVHVVLAYSWLPPERMLQRLKSRATRALRDRGLVSTERPVWADGPGSRRYLWSEADMADAAKYVREYQDEPH